MYYQNELEDICYEMSHINQVLAEIKSNIPLYFKGYIETEAGRGIAETEAARLAKALGTSSSPKPKVDNNYKTVLERIQKEAIADFEKDRKKYLKIFTEESFADYKLDVVSFKYNILGKDTPIIQRTLQNKKAKELDRYRLNFKAAQPGELFEVSKNITELAIDWSRNWYDPATFESLDTVEEMDYNALDGEDCVVPGVIGGGVKSTFIYKLFPYMFPVRSRAAVWAFWYLSAKKAFGCKEDSEFLIIDREKSTTQQNYYYPYGLFAFYALQVFNELKKQFSKHGVAISTDYRFVIVESFLAYVNACHQDEIDTLKNNNPDYRYED